MSNKTLKIKRIFAWTIYNSLRNTPPKDFPTTGEIKSTINDVLPALKAHVEYYVGLIEKASDLANKTASKEITEKVSNEEVEKLNKDFRDYSKEHGNELVEVALEDEGLKTLKTQFERDSWGKRWVSNLEEFGELSNALDGK